MTSKTIAVSVLVWLALIAGVPVKAETATVTYYRAECHDCGVREVRMGEHTFCALTHVLSGGMNAACIVRPVGKDWRLLAADLTDDPWVGESQTCDAMCIDIPGMSVRFVSAVPTVPTVPARPDLSGTWYDYTPNTGNKGQVSRIEQDGDRLVFFNAFGNRSPGRFLDASTVIATAWENGLRAKIEGGGDRIVFTNGSVWQRQRR
jgi:hypothetical protein